MTTPKRRYLTDITRPQLARYCGLHGYTLRTYNRTWDSKRAESWSKIPLLLSTIRREPHFDYYMWLDDDIFISELGCDIATLVEPYEERCATSAFGWKHTIIASADVVSSMPFNAGILLLRLDRGIRVNSTKLANSSHPYPRRQRERCTPAIPCPQPLLREAYALAHPLKKIFDANWEQDVLKHMYTGSADVRANFCV